MAGSSGDSNLTQEAVPRTLVLFDSHCMLCNGSVRWLLRHDRHDRLAFAPLDWIRGLAPTRPDSIVVLDEEGEHHESDAALRIVRALSAPWSWLGILRLLPRSLRDELYRLIARNRLAWFGSTETCLLPVGTETRKFPKEEDVARRLQACGRPKP